MYPRIFSKTVPDKPAVIMAGVNGAPKSQLTYCEMEAQANQAAHFFREMNLKAGDCVAFMLENRVDIFPFVWGAQRAGLLYVAVPTSLTYDEVEYILRDSQCKLILGSGRLSTEIMENVKANFSSLLTYLLDGADAGWEDWSIALESQSPTPIADESRGTDMLYSSGTTGRPKGIVPTIPWGEAPDAPQHQMGLVEHVFKVNQSSIFLSPAPLYHAAPLRWCTWVHMLGGTVVVMEKFDAKTTLSLIEDHKITHGQFVPTHFSRILKLDIAIRNTFDMSSLVIVFHAAAPCPLPIKQAMIDWWGPIIYEFYAGSESNGMTIISSEDWLTHPGSVGRAAFGVLHICDENGNEIPMGQEGEIFFSDGPQFSYLNAPEKTAAAHNDKGWSTLGDVGRIDEDGFLYLTDRKSFMIISGGVNIYPQEIENHLAVHPQVNDAAVIGVPDPDFGEKVLAVIQPVDMADANEEFAQQLEAYCREKLSGIKVPRAFEFLEEFPRTETGKLVKRKLQERFKT